MLAETYGLHPKARQLDWTLPKSRKRAVSNLIQKNSELKPTRRARKDLVASLQLVAAEHSSFVQKLFQLSKASEECMHGPCIVPAPRPLRTKEQVLRSR